MCQHNGEDGDLPVGARFCSGWHPVCRMAVPRIVFHCCNKGVEAQAARTGTVGVADRLPLSFREIRYCRFIAALDFNRTLMILTMKNSNLKDRMLGCLFGQAIGDALGLGSEFMDKNGVMALSVV